MRLANIRSAGPTRAARVDGDTLVVFEDELTDLLRRPGWLDIARTSDGARLPAEGVCFAPLVTKPDKIICAGLNYKGHIAETGRPVPEYPFFFSKFPAALIGARDDLELPTVSEQTDWEVELAVVIGKPARSVSESGALAAVAGYTIINDVTVRDWQHRGPTWPAGKTFEATTPLGPYLVTPEEFPPGEVDLELTCSVNGEQMQRSRTSDLLFGVPALIAYMSQVIALLPGDVIATGRNVCRRRGCSALRAKGRTMAIQRLGHIGIWVDDLQKMTKFYSEVLGLQITDATREDVTPGAVFLSSRPDKAHHELALMAGRTNHDPGRLINQISWMCESLEDLQGFKQRLAASEASFHEIVTHGMAVGIYFYDPEGNRSEVFAATGLDDVPQPYKKPVDLDQPLAGLLQDLDRQHQADGIPSSLAIRAPGPEEADMTSTPTQPATDIDLFSAEVVADPFPVLARVRALGPVVYSTKHGFYVLTRYEDVRAATGNWRSFTSAKGVALTDEFNQQLVGSVLASDPPEHGTLRAVLSDKLAPRGLAKTGEQISRYAHQLVAELVARGTFDGVVDVARVYPVNVVGDLVGLPMEGREKMQPGADATFAGFGPFNEYVMEHLPQLIAYTDWMGTMADRSKLTPGGWGEAVMDAVDEGRLTQLAAIKTLSAYLVAGMDTTVNAIGSLMRLLADRPDVWAALKADGRLAPPIFEEILRLETPVVGFFRVATRDTTIGESVIPAGAKVLLHWEAANRDPAKYPDPDTFDISRNPLDHLAFGYGPHACTGQGLARMEAAALLEALAAQVGAFELTGEPVRGRNPVVRGYESVPLRVVPGQRASR